MRPIRLLHVHMRGSDDGTTKDPPDPPGPPEHGNPRRAPAAVATDGWYRAWNRRSETNTKKIDSEMMNAAISRGMLARLDVEEKKEDASSAASAGAASAASAAASAARRLEEAVVKQRKQKKLRERKRRQKKRRK